MDNFCWVRNCWSLFISNLSLTVTSKDLYLLLREVGLVFDVFIPRDHQNGSLRGFAFVRFKTEWVANKAMQKLNGCLIGGRKIQIQMAQNDYGRQNIRMLTRRSLSVPAAHRSHRGFPSSHLPPAIRKAPGFHLSGHQAPFLDISLLLGLHRMADWLCLRLLLH